jgi:hypothetical protein
MSLVGWGQIFSFSSSNMDSGRHREIVFTERFLVPRCLRWVIVNALTDKAQAEDSTHDFSHEVERGRPFRAHAPGRHFITYTSIREPSQLPLIRHQTIARQAFV